MKTDHQIQIVAGGTIINLNVEIFYGLIQCYDWLNSDGSLPFALTPSQNQAIKDCRDAIEFALLDLAKQQPHQELPRRRFHTMDS